MLFLPSAETEKANWQFFQLFPLFKTQTSQKLLDID